MFIFCLLYLKFAEISSSEGWGFNNEDKCLPSFFGADFEAARLAFHVSFSLFLSVS